MRKRALLATDCDGDPYTTEKVQFKLFLCIGRHVRMGIKATGLTGRFTVHRSCRGAWRRACGSLK